MVTFADRLREEMEYLALTRKELAIKADVKQRALDMYLGTQGSMPPADVAVRLAKALQVTVEYLVTGEQQEKTSVQKSIKSKIERDLENCSTTTQNFLSTAVHLFSEYEKNFHNKK